MSNSQEIAQKKMRLSPFFEDDIIKKLHHIINIRLPKEETTLSSAARYHFAQPGKMLRGKMAVHSAELLKVNDTASLYWAAAIETLHNASLIHDDICDDDLIRRNQPSIWSKYGKNVALTLGDWLIALAFELAAEASQRAQTPTLVKILAQHMATTTSGEASEFSFNKVPDWSQYVKIASDKTAPLLTAPFEGVAAMALYGEASSSISAYFRSLGAAYQIANDLMNFRALDGAVSKGSDLARRAPNAVVVTYRETLSPDKLYRFDAWYSSGSNSDFESWLYEILSSRAMFTAAERMQDNLSQSSYLAEDMPLALAGAVSPVQELLQKVCMKATSLTET